MTKPMLESKSTTTVRNEIKEEPIIIEEGNFFKGLIYGTMLSVPLWLSILGWFRILTDHFG